MSPFLCPSFWPTAHHFMGQSICRKRAPSDAAATLQGGKVQGRSVAAGPFDDRDDAEEASAEDKTRADRLCQRCVLSYSRVSRETLMAGRTVGDLKDYLRDLRAREDQLNGFHGESDRVKEGLTGFGHH